MTRFMHLSTALALLTTLTACADQSPQRCQSMDDCQRGQICRLDACIWLNETPQARPVLLTRAMDASADTWEDASTDASSLTPSCKGKPPSGGELIIHEALMSVPPDTQGDANGDGVRDPYDDEFVEILNVSSSTIALFGVAFGTADKARHTFSQRCLGPSEAVVLFGGPRGRQPTLHQGTWHVTSATRLSMTNTQGTLWLKDRHGRTLSELNYNAPKAMSYTRSLQGSASGFVPHTDLAGALFSPGTCADGSPLSEGCLPPAKQGESDMGEDESFD